MMWYQALRSQGNLIYPDPAPIWPGLVGSEMDTETGKYLTFDYGWKAGIDSFLEVGLWLNISLRCKDSNMMF